MDSPEDARLESRVSNLESDVLWIKEQVGISRADAQAARMLAGGLDREIADMRTLVRAQTHLIHALRDTQIEHGERLNRHEQLLAGLRSDVNGLSSEVNSLRSDMQRGFGEMHTGMAHIVALLTNRERDESG